jgi:hypothetical protein
MPDSPSRVDLPERWRHEPTSFLLWGPQGRATEALIIALSQWIDPRFTVLDVHPPRTAVAPGRNRLLAGVPPSQRMMAVAPESLKPEAGIQGLALWKIVRGDEPREIVAPLVDFLRLPSLVQELPESHEPAGSVHALAVLGAEHLLPFYPNVRGATRPFVLSLNAAAMTVVASNASTGERADRFDMDHVYRVEPSAQGDLDSSVILVEQGLAEGPLRGGARVPARRVPGYAEIVERVEASS